MDADYPTAADLREIAASLYWLACTASGHDGPEARDTYRRQGNAILNVAALVEANPNYFTEQHTLRNAA